MMTLTPAFGRDYKSRKACIADLEAGKDFIINDASSPWDGKPTSVRTLKGRLVTVRYNRLTKAFTYQC